MNGEITQDAVKSRTQLESAESSLSFLWYTILGSNLRTTQAYFCPSRVSVFLLFITPEPVPPLPIDQKERYGDALSTVCNKGGGSWSFPTCTVTEMYLAKKYRIIILTS